MTTAPERTSRVSELEAIICLNVIFSSWQLLEGLDRIKGTTLYRHDLKRKLNVLLPDLEKYVDNVETFYRIDNAAMNNLMEYKRTLTDKLICIRPEHQAVLDEVLGLFFEDPQFVMDKLDIKIVKKND